MRVHGIQHGLDCARQVTLILAKQVFEHLQAIGVHEVMEDHRVVERTRRELLVGAGVERQRAELVLRRAEQVLSVIQCCPRPVRFAQMRGEADEECGEHQIVAPIRRRLLLRRCIPAARKKEDGAAVTDEVGERLVEVGVAADVAGVVQELMDDHVRQRSAVVAQEV